MTPSTHRRSTRPAQPIPTISFAEPVVYDTFRLDGTYLGELRLPTGNRVGAFASGAIWGTTTDQDDIPVLVKYRFATSGDH